MNYRCLFLISLLIGLSIGCKKQTKVFTESDSLIELSAVRLNELINDNSGYAGMSSKDGRFWDNVYPAVTGIPDSLLEVKIYYQWLNNVQALYQSYKAGDVDKTDFDYYYNAWGSDTVNCISNYVKTFVIIASGTSKTGQRYYLFDSDNDFNLGDEIPYETSKVTNRRFINDNKEYQPHKVIYEKVIDGDIQQDSTWIAFFENDDRMWIQFCDISSTTFQFDTIIYKMKVRPSLGQRYSGGTIFNVSKGFNKRSKDYLAGEYLKLGTSLYQLSCSNDGLKIYLTKDDSAIEHGSTQIGMPPFKFSAKTLKGDTINFPYDFKGRYVLLDFWALSCPPCIQEIKDFYIDIYEKYGGNQFEIIGVADDEVQDLNNFVDKNGTKWIIIPDGQQKVILKKFNITYYPTLYFINPEGIIIAKDNELRGGQFVSTLSENIKTN